MAHDTSDLLSFYLKQQQAYLACKAHLVREYCHQAHSGHVPCRICTLECFLVIHSYLILICCWFTARGSSKTTGVHGVVQGDPECFGGSSPGLPFPCSPFPVGTAMLCLPSGFAPILQKGHLLKVCNLLCARVVATCYSMGFLCSWGHHLLPGVSGTYHQRISAYELSQY